jgi:uncharacterized membrane protein YwzB
LGVERVFFIAKVWWALRLGSDLVNEHYRKEGSVGLLELLLIVLVVAAIVGGIGVSPLLWLLLLVALVVFFTGGGFGYRRGGRV